MSANTVAEEELVMTRVFDAPRERVFDVFTKPEHIRKWWGPKRSSVPVAEFDARVGGEVFLANKLDDHPTAYCAGVVREITPPARVVFAFHFTDEKRRRVPLSWAGVPPEWEGEIVHEVTLAPEGERTRVTIRLTGFPSTQWGEMAQLGLAESLDRVENAVSGNNLVGRDGEG